MTVANEDTRHVTMGFTHTDAGFLSLIALVPLALHLWLAAALPLTEDEAYYRLWSLSPALSYYDHPPMVAWLIAAGRWLIGDTALGLRLAGVLATGLSTLALYRTAYILLGAREALIATAFAASMPLLGVGAIVTTPDMPSVLFYVLGGWALAELHVSRKANWWLAVGLFAGFGLLSKYTNFFFGVAILTWLLSTRRAWHWFAKWQLYAGGLIALALFTPVIVWNFNHDWASISKQFGRVVDVDGLKFAWQLELWGTLALLAGPVLLVLAARGACTALQRWRVTGDPAPALLLALTAPLLAYFLLHALHGRVQPNWLAPAYPFLALLAATGVTTIEYRSRARWVRLAIATSAAITAVIYAHAVEPFYVSARIKDPTHQMRGWPEFVAGVEKAALQAGAAYIATTSYGTTAQLAFHLGDRWPVLQLNEGIRYVHLSPPDAGLFTRPGIVVEIPRRNPQAELLSRYKKVRSIGSLTRSYRGVPLQSYAIFSVSDPKAPVAVPEHRGSE